MTWKLAYHHDKDGETLLGSPSLEHLVGCILNGCPVRVMIIQFEKVLVCDTVAICVAPAPAPNLVSALLPIRPSTNECCELNQIFAMSAIAVDTTGRYSRIDSSSRGRLSKDFFEMKWFVNE